LPRRGTASPCGGVDPEGPITGDETAGPPSSPRPAMTARRRLDSRRATTVCARQVSHRVRVKPRRGGPGLRRAGRGARWSAWDAWPSLECRGAR